MSCELNLQFPDHEHAVVYFDGETTATLKFASLLAAKDRQDIQWYLEVYGAHSLGGADESQAQRVAAQWPEWGKVLFAAVSSDRAAERLFNRFQDSKDAARQLSISAEHPAVLASSWEALCDPPPGGDFQRPEGALAANLAASR
jgi:hypothetical protein